MPAKQTRKKVQKEARRVDRRDAERHESLVALQRRNVVLIQAYFRFIFVDIPHMLYGHLQSLIVNRRPTDLAFRHFPYRRVHKGEFARCHPGRILGREGEIFIHDERSLYALDFQAGRDRFAVNFKWMLRISPFAPIEITTVMFRYNPARDGQCMPLRKDWILYMQARTDLLHDQYFVVDLSVGKWVYHFLDAKAAAAFIERIIPSL
jgi:hypothetical protein